MRNRMPPEDTESKKSFRNAVRGDLLLVLIAGGLFTAFALQWSFQNGRLTRDPSFDDVVYFVDGLERVRVLYDHGFEGLFRDLWKNPPHSPWSTGLASLSFLLLGAHDWVPYLANGIVVVLFLTLSLLVAARKGPGSQSAHQSALPVRFPGPCALCRTLGPMSPLRFSPRAGYFSRCRGSVSPRLQSTLEPSDGC